MIAANHFRGVLVLLLLLSCASAAVAADTYQLTIPSQPLAKALQAFAAQAGLTVVHYAETTENKLAPALEGRFTREEALGKLLAESGLTFEYVNAETVAIRAPRKEAEGDPLAVAQATDASPAPALPTPGTETQSSADGSSTPRSGSSLVRGHVSDASAGSNLPGALVRVLESGQVTQTDELGNFRFSGLAAGEYTLSISYLGFTEKLWRIAVGSERAPITEYSLEKSAWDVAEVTVFGTRSARALALNQQRTAENSSSIVSADMLGNFTGTTISEELRRVQGITFTRDPITGDGTNIMVRGLAPSLNAVTLNGLNLPATYLKNQRFDRSPDISYLLADSISKIKVNYSLLPSHSSTGTGGLVQIETKSPLDRPNRFANFSVEGARKGGGFGKDFLASGTVSGTFGEKKNMGLSASVQYRERSDRSFNYTTTLVYGPFLPLDENGVPLEDLGHVDPRTHFPFEPQSARAFPNAVSNNLVDVDIENLTATVSAAWQPTDQTSLRLDLTRATDVRDSYSRFANLTARMQPAFLPVAALDGQSRWMYNWDPSDGGGVVLDHRYELGRGARSLTDTAALNGKSSWGKFDVDYRLGYARGSNANPGDFNLSVVHLAQGSGPFDPASVSPQAVDPIEDRIISPFGERTGRGYPGALLTQAGYDYFNQSANYLVGPGASYITLSDSAGYDAKKTGDLSARYNLDRGIFKYLEAGANFERSNFKTTRMNSTAFDAACSFPDCPTIADLGMQFQEPGLAAIGISRPAFNFISRDTFTDFANRLPQLTRGANPLLIRYDSMLDPRIFQEYTQEDSLAAYLQARVDIGRLEIIGGARMARADVSNGTLSVPGVILANGLSDDQFNLQFTRLVEMQGVATDILPRVEANWRQTDNLIYRGAYFLSVARPSLQDLSAEQSVYLDFSYFDGNTGRQRPRLDIYQGTPGLKPTSTDNFDLSVEYYHDQLGLLRLSGFYKLSRNLLETNTSKTYNGVGDTVLPDHPYFENLPADLLVVRQQPANSPDSAYLWGVAAGVERQLAFLPGIWSGLGVYANLTYTDSSSVQKALWYYAPTFDENGNVVSPGRDDALRIKGQPYAQDSPLSGTASLTYNKYGIDASLVYTFQDRSRAVFDSYNLRYFTEGVRTLDFRIARQFSASIGKYTVYLEGANLLKGRRDSDLETSVGGGHTPKFYTSGSFIGGRQFRVGVSGSF